MVGVVDTGYDIPDSYNHEAFEFYGGKDPYWSFLNYVNTNQRSFNILLKAYNEAMNKENRLLEINSLNDIEKLNNFIAENGDELFKPSYGIFRDVLDNMISAISRTRYIGDKAEEIAGNILSDIYNMTGVDKSVPGDMRDAFYGVDLTFEFKGETKKVQCKNFRNEKYKFENGKHIFDESVVTDYKNIDFFIFINTYVKKYYIFRSRLRSTGERFEINSNKYIFNESLRVDDGKYEF